jgi:diguanylate cyclase (GGDEF)-like protein
LTFIQLLKLAISVVSIVFIAIHVYRTTRFVVRYKWHYVVFLIGLMLFEIVSIQQALQNNQLWSLTLLSVVLMLLGTGIVARELKKNLSKDQLTGLTTRKYFFEEILRKELKRAERSKKSVAVLLLDLNNFKTINDTYGHKAGDELLKKFSKIIKESIRESDIAVRLGGDEILLFLPETDEEGAKRVLERIQKNLEKISLDGIEIGVTGGIASWREGEDFSATLEKADMDLYKKKEGKR